MKKQTTVLNILIVLVIAIALTLVFVETPLSDLKTVPVILPAASPDDGDGEDEEEAPPRPIEITTDSVQAVIRTLSRADAYSRTISAVSYLDGEEVSRTVDVWVRSDAAKMVVSRSDTDETVNVLVLGDEKWIWYEGLYGSYHGAAADSEADRYQGILSYETVLDVSKSDITAAEYTEHLGEMCICVRYNSPLPGYENICYVSVESGLAIAEECYAHGELVFRAESTLADFAVPDDIHFRQP